MFGRKASKISTPLNNPAPRSARPALIETLEDRRLLSASIVHPAVAHAAHHTAAKHASLKHHATKTTTASSTTSSTSTAAAITAAVTAATTSTTSGSSTFDPADGGLVDTIEFSQAPTAVQSGLTTLASTDSLAVPTAAQTVYLGNSNGVETYTLEYTSTGMASKITVDLNGNAVTAPVQSTVTWATLDGTGAGSNTTAAAEISAIATALNLTAPTDTTTVTVSTMSDGTALYSVRLSSSTSSDDGHDAPIIRVDSSGNPLGPMTIPFSVVPMAVQNGINNNLPTGATALAATSTQNVDVLTENGVTFFSTTFTTSGTSTIVTVNLAGTSVSLPSTTTTTFDSIPLAAQTELQTLATADGVTGTISSSQSVTAYTEGNGTVIYSVTLSALNGDSQTVDITIASDQLGNPTVPPENRGEGCGHGEGGWDDSDNADFGAVDFGLASFGGGHFRGS